MIRCYLLDEVFAEKTYDDFSEIADIVNKNRAQLNDLGLDLIIEFLARLGRQLIRDTAINNAPGITYISMWLRRENLERICRMNFGNRAYADDFSQFEEYCELNAQPRGIVCHWIAGNVPTISFFSLVQAILSKNGSIVKVPEGQSGLILRILRDLGDLEIERDGRKHSGMEIVRSVAIVSFSSGQHELTRHFSMTADVRVVWGGADAIRAITALPQKEHCETIVFGPKYSFGAFDRAFIESADFDKAIENAAKDVVVFNQMACSSPHVFFFEKSKYSIGEIAGKLRTAFEKMPAKLLDQPTPPGTAARIINARAIHLLSFDKNAMMPEDLGWTILVNGDVALEEPVQGKCIFIKEVGDITEVLDLITRKVQAISTGIADPGRKRDFAKRAAYRGVDRIVAPGKMHDFDLPWDGILPLNRLVRWIILKD
jgi:Acyl-CoA reductase (LuxC)